jgi:hypothetical protein
MVLLVDYLPRLSTINCRKLQSTLLMKNSSVQIEDGLFIAQQVTKKRIARREETHIIFIDLEKEYGSVESNVANYARV